MHALLEFLAGISVALLPEWIQRNVSPKNQLWVTLGCTFLMLLLVVLVVVYFAAH